MSQRDVMVFVIVRKDEFLNFWICIYLYVSVFWLCYHSLNESSSRHSLWPLFHDDLVNQYQIGMKNRSSAVWIWSRLASSLIFSPPLKSLPMDKHVSSVSVTCFHCLCKLRCIWRSLAEYWVGSNTRAYFHDSACWLLQHTAALKTTTKSYVS